MNTKKIIKSTAVAVAVALLITCIVFLISNLPMLKIAPFESALLWESPSFVTGCGDRLFVVDSSKTRISILDGDGKIINLIFASSDEESFSNTDYIACDGKHLYVADVVYASSGTRVSEEHIKKFTLDGEYISTVFSVTYEDGKENMPAQNGYICWMGSDGDMVHFIYSDKKSLSINRITDSGTQELRTIDNLPEIWNLAYSASEDKVYFVGKDSLVRSENDSRTEFEKMKSLTGDKRSIFSDIDASGTRVYVTDLGMKQVVSGDGKVLFGGDNPAENTLIYRVAATDSGFAVTDNMSVWSVDYDGNLLFEGDRAKYSGSLYAKVLFAWLSLILLILALVFFITVMIVTTLRNSRSKFTSVTILLAFAIIISTTIISYTVLKDTFARLTAASYLSLVRTAAVISSSSSENGIGDAILNIDAIDDYGNDSHLMLQRYFDSFCDAAYDTDSNMYYVLFRIDPENDLVYGIADYEKTAGAIYPYCPYDGSDYQTTAETGEIISVAASMDAYGAWSFAVAPLFDSDGNVSGVVELGINMQTERAQNIDIITTIIERVAVIILILILAIIEGSALADGAAKLRTEHDPDIPYLLRPMMFLTFLASNLSAAFIPQMSLELFKASGLYDDANVASFASALPMSIQLMAIAVAALFAGRLLEKVSMKTIMLISCAVQVAGYTVIAFASFAEDYIIFCAGHVLSGLGIGVVIVSLNTLPDRIGDEALRGSYYAGLNAGIISGVVIGSSIGSYIADFTSHALTYIFSAGIVLITALLIAISVKDGKYTSDASTKLDDRIGTLRFLFNKDVLNFIVCVMVPMLILLYFKDYLFPMFGYDNGMNDIGIGNILLFAGAASIVFGTTLSDRLLEHLGTLGTVITSSTLICGTLIMFGLFPSIETAIAAVMILSLATGFGLGAQEVFYSSLPSFRNFGAQRSMSVYSIFDNISQSAGPLLLGGLLFLGYGKECLILGIGGLVLLGIFLLVRLISEGSKGSKIK